MKHIHGHSPPSADSRMGIQASKNPLVRSYLRVPQAAGQVKLWMISNEINIFFHIYQ